MGSWSSVGDVDCEVEGIDCSGVGGMGEIMTGDGTGCGKKIDVDEGVVLGVSVGVEVLEEKEGCPNMRCHKRLSLQMVFTKGVVSEGKGDAGSKVMM
ncbi:hypothetical protein Tco_1315218 [Tanacetum coccineum]